MAEAADKAQSIARRSAVMSAITLVSRLTGYVRVVVMAYALGATAPVIFSGVKVGLGDSYNLSNIIPNIIFDLLVGGILYSLFVPILVEQMAGENKDEIWHVASSMINVTAVFCLVLSVAGFIFAGPITHLLTGTKTQAEAVLVTWLFRFFSWQIFFYGLAAVFTGILNAYRHFVAPTIAPLANNIIVITTGILFYNIPPKNLQLALAVLAIGTTLGVVMMAAVQVPSLFKIGMRYRFAFDIRHPAIKKLAKLAVPMLGYTAISQLGFIITNRIAWHSWGGVTGFQYGWQFFQLPYAIFAVSIMTAIFPELSEQFANQNMKRFKETVSMGIRSIGIIVLPLSVLMIVLAKPLIQVALEYGRFNAAATAVTSGMLFYFSFGLFSFALYMLLVRVFYSMHDTKTPMVVNAVGVSANIGLNYLFVHFIGVSGLALAQTITYTFATAMIFYMLRKRIGAFGGRQIVTSSAKYVLASLPTGAVAYFIYRALAQYGPEVAAGVGKTAKIMSALSRGGQFGVAAFAGLLVYLAAIYLLKVEEVSIMKKFGRRLVSLVKP